MQEPLRQLKQQTHPSARILDFYLFVHPLGKKCYQCELELLTFIQSIPYKAHVHFIAFHNFQTAAQRFAHQNPTLSLEQRNAHYRNSFDAALAYKAATLQGKRIGRQFLMTLQHKVHVDKRNYDAELLDELVAEVGLDRKSFYEDKQSPQLVCDYEKDQRIAHEMNIQSTPSLVIFDNANHHYGLLIDNGITSSNIAVLCHPTHQLSAKRHELVLHEQQITYLQYLISLTHGVYGQAKG